MLAEKARKGYRRARGRARRERGTRRSDQTDCRQCRPNVLKMSLMTDMAKTYARHESAENL